jgi:ribonuclease H2 subunit A
MICCSQVTRDRILSNWQWAESHLTFADDRAYGSGYPGDARCVQWLARNLEPTFGFPDVLRFRYELIFEVSTILLSLLL